MTYSLTLVLELLPKYLLPNIKPRLLPLRQLPPRMTECLSHDGSYVGAQSFDRQHRLPVIYAETDTVAVNDDYAGVHLVQEGNVSESLCNRIP